MASDLEHLENIRNITTTAAFGKSVEDAEINENDKNKYICAVCNINYENNKRYRKHIRGMTYDPFGTV